MFAASIAVFQAIGTLLGSGGKAQMVGLALFIAILVASLVGLVVWSVRTGRRKSPSALDSQTKSDKTP